MQDEEALKYIRIICIFIMGIVLSLVSWFVYVSISSPTPPPEMPVTAPPTFSWPVIDPEFLRCGNVIVSYEFVSEGRHLIAIKDLNNLDGSYIMPLFETRAEAIDFQTNYFNWLKMYYGGEK